LRSASVTSTLAAARCLFVAEREVATRDRDGRLGLGTAAALARRTPGSTDRSAVLRHRRPDLGATLVGCRRARRASSSRRSGRRAASVRAASATPCSCRGTGPGGSPSEHHPAPAWSCEPRHHLDLPAGHRSRGDHRRSSYETRPDDVRHGRTPVLRNPLSAGALRNQRSAPGSSLAGTRWNETWALAFGEERRSGIVAARPASQGICRQGRAAPAALSVWPPCPDSQRAGLVAITIAMAVTQPQ
jgi:hypothetical protein